jgi:biotin operon repressor
MVTADRFSCDDETVRKAAQRGLVEPGVAQRARLLCRLAAVGSDSLKTARLAAGQRHSTEARPAVSGEVLAGELEVSRAAIHKHVATLQYLGIEVDAIPGRGYHLASLPLDLLCPEVVVPLVAPDVIERVEQGRFALGLPYRFEERCESTNALLKQTASASGNAQSARQSGTVCACSCQTVGRGRLGREWTSEPGKDLTFSVLLRPRLVPQQSHLLSLAAAVAVGETLECQAGCARQVTVKWPNDVLLGGGKVCGILLEGSIELDRVQWAVAGIGLNVNSRPSTAAGLAARAPSSSGSPGAVVGVDPVPVGVALRGAGAGQYPAAHRLDQAAGRTYRPPGTRDVGRRDGGGPRDRGRYRLRRRTSDRGGGWSGDPCAGRRCHPVRVR